jgi:hypothetical protein
MPPVEGLSGKYTFSTSTAANIFFGRSLHWFVRLVRTPMVLASGTLIETPMVNGRRVYTLDHIQDIAMALTLRGDLRPEHCAKVIKNLKQVSDLWEGDYGRL